MISRRLYIASVVTLIPAPRAVASQQSAPRRIGYLAPGDAASEAPYYEGFRRGLTALGYIEGQDVFIEFRPTENRLEPIVSGLKLGRQCIGRFPRKEWLSSRIYMR